MSYELEQVSEDLLPMLHARVPAELVFWTVDELYNWLDEKLKLLAKEGAFVVRDTVGITAAVASYDAPNRHLSTIFVSHNNAPLRPTSTQELELKDPAYVTTAGTPVYWYADRGGYNRIGLYPVPNAAAIVLASSIEVIYHQYPAAPDGWLTSTIPVPSVVAELLEMEVIIEAYAKESDSQCPEIAAHLVEVVKLIKSAVIGLWGSR